MTWRKVALLAFLAVLLSSVTAAWGNNNIEAAKKGDPMAMSVVGKAYYEGLGVDKSRTKGSEWLLKAAKKNFQPAFDEMLRLADKPKECAEASLAAARIFSIAKELNALTFRGSKEKESFNLSENEALSYQYGIKYAQRAIKTGGKKFLSTVIKAAEGNNPLIMTALGLAFYKGQDVTKDTKQGAQWLLDAAKLPYPAAMEELLNISKNDKDGAEAAFALIQLAKGEEEILERVSSALNLGGKAMAERIARMAGEGDTSLILALGKAYYEGTGVSKDQQKGTEWLLKAIKLKHQPAMNELQRLAGTDDGAEAAFALIQLATSEEEILARVSRALSIGGKAMAERIARLAGEGDAPLMLALGKAYYEGTGVSKDQQKGTEWLVKAVKLKHQPAMNELQRLAAADDGGEAAFTLIRLAENDEETIERVSRALIIGGNSMAERIARLAGEKDASLILALGKAYYEGTGIKKDQQKGTELLAKAISLNSQTALNELLRLAGTDDGAEAAFKLVQLANSEQEILERVSRALTLGGSAMAERLDDLAGEEDARLILALGKAFYEGVTIEKDQAKGTEYLVKAVKLKYQPAMEELLNLSNTDDGAEAAFTLIQLAETSEDITVQVSRALTLGGDTMAERISALAGENNTDLMLVLGKAFYEGAGIEKNQAKGVEWMVKAAKLNCRPALDELLRLANAEGGTEPAFAVIQLASSEAEAVERATHALKLGGDAMAERIALLAENGDSSFMLLLGKAFYNGESVTKDQLKGTEWLVRAAKLKNQAAFDELVNLSNTDDGAEAAFALISLSSGQDETDSRAARAITLGGNAMAERTAALASEDNARIMLALGKVFYHGTGVDKDQLKGIEWMVKAVKLGHQPALDELISLANSDDGTEAAFTLIQFASDEAETFTRVSRALTLGGETIAERIAELTGNDNTMLMLTLGKAFYEGSGIAKDHVKGVEWMVKAAKLSYQPALDKLISLAELDDGAEPAFALIQLAANEDETLERAARALTLGGDSMAERIAALAGEDNATLMLALGKAFYEGSGVENDHVKGVEWMVKAAKLIYQPALDKLISLAELDDGAEPAFALIQLAANENETLERAARALTLGGDSMAERIAALAGEDNAPLMLALGKAFYEGSGVEKDQTKGIEWMVKAAKLKHSPTLDELFRLSKTDEGAEAAMALKKLLLEASF